MINVLIVLFIILGVPTLFGLWFSWYLAYDNDTFIDIWHDSEIFRAPGIGFVIMCITLFVIMKWLAYVIVEYIKEIKKQLFK